MERIPECGSHHPQTTDARQEVRKLAMEEMKKLTQDKPCKGVEARVAMANVEATGRPPKKFKFAEALGCTGVHPPWKCRAFGDITPEER